jgi:hypothetical protein
MTDEGHRAFYRKALETMQDSGIPFMVGGAFALAFYADVHRDVKDLDLFIHPRDAESTVEMFKRSGYDAHMVAPHWLAKVLAEDCLVDLIFGSRNGVSIVDDVWFEHAVDATVLDMPVKLTPVEETIWSKGFVMDRGRYDGADIVHLVLHKGAEIDWRRLIDRFGENWPVLFNYLVLFAFFYPSRRRLVPAWVEWELLQRWRESRADEATPASVCRGTLVSQTDFQPDIERWGFLDARVVPLGNLTPEQLAD